MHKTLQKPIAHSPNSQGEEHYLHQHLGEVAKLTASFLQELHLDELGYYTGLWHDLGKYAPQWQKALQEAISYEKNTGKRQGRLGVPHALHGAKLALDYSPLVAMCIAGHHSGLGDKSKFKGKLEQKLLDLEEVKAAIQKDLPDCFNITKKLEPQFTRYTNKLKIDLTTRLLFSALIDADRLDTVAHTEGINHQNNNYLQMSELQLQFDLKRLEIIKKNHIESEVNRIREEIYHYCTEAGKMAPGIYKLCAPTGGGKTFALQGFALSHAVKNKLSRIIYAAPFTTIIEQTAAIYRSMFHPNTVLEHHSSIQEETDRNDDINQTRLAVQNWDSLIIITTTVQLLESLFSNHPSKCRKIHNIAGAVIVIDEVQALPAKLMTPILSMLQNLVDYAGCSILLCTATQPAYEFIKNINCQPVDVIPKRVIQEHFIKLKRVEYLQTKTAWNWEDVKKDIQARKLQQVLIVANTTIDARNGFREIRQISSENCYHLSTRMYPKHRLRVLNKVRELLANDQPCYLISTQLIEAGVDLDFADGYRVIAPLDSIVQSAGRINRNGKLERLGTMTIFQLEKGKYPNGDYKNCAVTAQKIIDLGNDLNNPDTFHKYFQKRDEERDTDKNEIQNLREKLEFEQVANNFKLIEDESESVFIAEEIEAKNLLLEIEKKGFITKTDFQKAQNYMVKLPSTLDKQFNPVAGLQVWTGAYNLEYGVE
jgi:CRISPR-associated endonuclease/helicase Cas3